MGKMASIVITADGGNDELIWRSVYDNCLGEVEVVVPPSRECIVYKDGLMLETLQPGRHTINVPHLKGVFIKKITDSPFECRAYFVKKGGVQRVDWGTPSRMKIIDPFCNYPISIGAHGSFNVTISNSRKFVAKLVGDNKSFDTEKLCDELSFAFLGEIKGLLATAMTKRGINSYDLYANLPVLSKEIGAMVRDMFDEYGVFVDKFVISDIFIPDEDRAELEQIMKKKRLLEMQESSFKEERDFAQSAAAKEADMTYKLAQLDASVAGKVAESIGRMGQGVVKPTASQGVLHCPGCNNVVRNTDSFCPKCGTKLK